MKIIVGLGNPGREYEKTRHNLGFMVLDKLSDKLKIDINKSKFQGEIGQGKYKDEKVLLVKPQTYMNLSGDCVLEVINFYKEKPENLVVIYDDIDIQIGKIRVRPSGSAGTHNGVKDITKKVNSQQFARVRVGSGKPRLEQDLADFVLSGFNEDEKNKVNESVENAANAVIEILENGVASAMNKFN